MWSEDKIIEEIQKLCSNGIVLTYTEAWDSYKGLVMAAYRKFGSWRRAVEKAGFIYPDRGHCSWRIKVYRENPDLFLKEISLQKMETGSALAFAKEQGISLPRLPKVLNCKRCGKKFLVPKRSGRKYCDECRIIVRKESLKRRVKKWMAKPENRPKIRAYAKKYYRSHKQQHCEYVKAWQKKNPQRLRDYQRKRYWKNPELARAKSRARYWKRKAEQLMKMKKLSKGE